jgi:hypothetical protein
MNDRIEKFTSNLTKNDVLSESAFDSTIKNTNCLFSEDYLLFMKARNGGEGIINDGAFVRFWKVEELEEANADYMTHEFAPDLFLIGSNGGDTAYGIHRETGAFVDVPFIGMSNEEATERGKDFTEFLTYLAFWKL